mmetsp:Transcript_32976/g.72017  ORF Transcript_32976/g.72017 Transcript_32976/m.72017 type:complete len:150 (+) Transcript_32976:103-552(+)
MASPTPLQAAEIGSAFDIFDADRDESIAANELEAALRSVGMQPSKEAIAAHKDEYEAKDKNEASGKIHKSEFAGIVQRDLPAGDAPETITKLFAALSAKDVITRESLRSGMAKLGERMSDKEIDKMFDDADPGETGEISFAGFSRHLSG